MAFSINTNVVSLQAQEYLRLSGDFQAKTINRVTSGLRIVSSGDDAAGLAIANVFRSDRAVISQGIRNVNDGMSTLQTIDGGINNISQLLDRARTLAAQSASGTFTGDRSVLNSEFQSVLDEIDRQATAIGLNTGGSFARSIGVFIGGGRGANDAAVISNGTVSVDLSTSTVDSQSLGLKGYQAVGVDGTDIGNGNSTTKVSEIVANTNNTASLATAGYTEFIFRGAGFSDANGVKVAVNLSGVTDTTTLASAINAAIESAGNAGTQYATAFKNAGIQATIVTDSATGKQRLAFNSAAAAFQVAGADKMATALMGKFESGSTGVAVDYSVSGHSTVTGTDTFAKASSVIVRLQGSSLASPVDLSFSVTTSTTVNQALTSLSSLVANNSALEAAGIRLETATSGSAIKFTSKRGEKFEVLVGGDDGNVLKLGSAQLPSTTFEYSSVTGSSGVFNVAGTHELLVSIGGDSWKTISIDATTDSTVDTVLADINSVIARDADLSRAGLYATKSGGQLQITSHNGTYFRISNGTLASTFNFGFGTTDGTSSTTSTSGGLASASDNATINSGGAYSSGALDFSAVRSGGDDQTITVSVTDSSGATHAKAINLQADTTLRSARSIDEAIAYINAQLQSTNNAALQKVVAVKEYNVTSDTEKIVFLNPQSAVKVSVGDNVGDVGITTSQGGVVTATQLSGGANADVSTKENAESAVTALAQAVEALGRAQAVVGKGQNRFNFAINLAQTQLNNIAASEARIRDADLASEAANLTKAQILQQAGIAALAQANVAPQAVLSLLRG